MIPEADDQPPDDVLIRINELCNQYEFEWKHDSRGQLLTRLMEGVERQYRSHLASELIALDAELCRTAEKANELKDYLHIEGISSSAITEILRLEKTSADETVVAGVGFLSDSTGHELFNNFGEYTVLEEIGSGGMGAVYKALHRRMQRLVAIKTLRPDCSRDPKFRERFDREVRAAALLRHPNIVTAFDAGEANGLPFLVTEFVEADDLAATVSQSGPLPISDAHNVILQAATGLQYVHEQGIVHRDVKPANLLRDKDGVVKLLDVGLSRLVGVGEDLQGSAQQADSELSSQGSMMGTVDFMSPEQARDSHEADERADIYSLGCTLFYLLSGQKCFSGSTVLDRVLAHREQPIPVLKSPLGTVPDSLNAVFRKMLAKRPEDRQQSVSELIDELNLCRADVERSMTGDVPTGQSRLSKNGSRNAILLVSLTSLVLVIVGLETARRMFTTGTQPAPAVIRTGAPGLASVPFDAATAGDLQSKWARHLNVDERLTDSVTGIDFVLIPPGEFLRGSKQDGIDLMANQLQQQRGNERPDDQLVDSEMPQSRVTITKPFYLSTTEITNSQFRRFVDAMNYVTEVESTDRGYGIRGNKWTNRQGDYFDWKQMGLATSVRTDLHPVGNVTRADAIAYCHWCSRETIVYRLPTEAEWEFACRAGTQSLWSWGDDIASIEDYAVIKNSVAARQFSNPARVGTKQPNAFGLFDMHGNVSEICEDSFAYDTYRLDHSRMVDPLAKLVDPVRRSTQEGNWNFVRRGGSVYDTVDASRSAARQINGRGDTSYIGIRLVREVVPQP